MSFVLVRRAVGATALGMLLALAAMLWNSTPVQHVVGDIARGVQTAWAEPCAVPVGRVWTDDHSRFHRLRGASVYLWDGQNLRWLGLVLEYQAASESSPGRLVYRPAFSLDARDLEAIIYDRRFTIEEIIAFVVARPEAKQAVEEFFDTVAAAAVEQLPRLGAVAWDAGLAELVDELVDHVAEEFQRHSDELGAATARIVQEVLAQLQEPEVRRHWEPVIREELGPVVKQLIKDAVTITWSDTGQFGRRLLDAIQRDDVTFWDALAELVLARLSDAFQENAEEIRRATARCVRRLVRDPELRAKLVRRLEPSVRDELDRVVEPLLTAVRNAFQDPGFRQRIRDFLLNDELRAEVTRLVDQFQDDAYELIQQITQPNGRLREEVALMAKVNALRKGLPLVILRPRTTSNTRQNVAQRGE